jgi:hypothetical protein
MNTGEPTGPSFVHFEPPDILFWQVVGDLSEAEMLRLRAAARSLSAGRPYVLSLVDLSRIGTVSAGARKASIDPEPVAPLLGTAIFGATFTIQVVAQLVSRAGDLLLKPKDSLDASSIQFFATEDLARAWLVERREVARLKTR